MVEVYSHWHVRSSPSFLEVLAMLVCMVVTPLGGGGCTPSCFAWRFTYIAHVCWWIILWWCLRLLLALVYSYLSTLLCTYLLYRPCFSLACVSHTYSHMYWCPHTHSQCGAFYDGAPSLPFTLLRWCPHCSCGGSHILLDMVRAGCFSISPIPCFW